MRILFIRHGESEGNVDPLQYQLKGDVSVGLTDTGWNQLIGTGEFLSSYYAKTGTNDWPTFFVSNYQRTKESFSGILHGIDGTFSGQPKVHQEARLIEQFFGAMGRKKFPDGIFDPTLAKELIKMAEHTYSVDKFTTRLLLGESRMDTYLRVRSMMEGTLMKKVELGEDDFVFVCHGQVIQEGVKVCADVDPFVKLANPGNGDVIEAIGDELGKMKITKIYDGKSKTPCHDPYIDHVKPFELSDLPPIPQHILDALDP